MPFTLRAQLALTIVRPYNRRDRPQQSSTTHRSTTRRTRLENGYPYRASEPGQPGPRIPQYQGADLRKTLRTGQLRHALFRLGGGGVSQALSMKPPARVAAWTLSVSLPYNGRFPTSQRLRS